MSTERLLVLWRLLERLPGGRWIFSWLLGRFVPYSGTVHPRVLTLEPGWARIAMQDRRPVRNHLSSLHAIALANLAELTSGLAMTTALQPGTRGIVLRISVDYRKKARGLVVAECRCGPPAVDVATEFEIQSRVTDAAGDVVAIATVTWLLDRARGAAELAASS